MWEKCEKNSKKQVRNYLLRGRRELRKSEQWKKIKNGENANFGRNKYS